MGRCIYIPNCFLVCRIYGVGEVSTEERYYIWSIEHGAWWKAKSGGYTASDSMAGLYSKKEAFEISARANWSSLNEVPVPESFFEYQKQCHESLEKAVGTTNRSHKLT